MLVTSPMPAALVGSNGPVCGHTVLLSHAETTIGRAPASGICVPDRSVSREHCVIRAVDGHFEIQDLDSYNGTFVNGLRIRSHFLNDGDEIVAGEIVFVFRADSGGANVAIGRSAVEDSQSCTVWAPDVPLARETVALKRVSEIARTLQSLYLETSGERRREFESHLFNLICELIPSRRGALVALEGDRTVPLAGFEAPGEPQTTPIPEAVFEEIARTRITMTGRAGGSTWLAAPLIVSERVLAVLYLDSGGIARDYLQGDIQMITALGEILGLALENARDIESLRVENVQLRGGPGQGMLMIGNSVLMRGLYENIAKVARGNSTVLIRGESGTGKELVARAIHRNGPRASRPFIVVNCAAIAETLLESEFFGHEKGAFTGAYAQRKGKLEQADGGTVFLDEIGELAPPMQAKLLRVLQEHEFERVGGTRTIHVDIRLIAATNRDLEQAIKQGAFREDLYYRLNVVRLRVPPLRERREDIPLLANWFVRKFSEQTGRAVKGLSREARAMLVAYDWPGNVRELQNAIERAVVMGLSDVVTPGDLSDLMPDAAFPSEAETGAFHEAIRQTRRKLIAIALERAGGSVPEAARALGLHTNYLHRLITTLGLRDSGLEELQ